MSAAKLDYADLVASMRGQLELLDARRALLLRGIAACEILILDGMLPASRRPSLIVRISGSGDANG